MVLKSVFHVIGREEAAESFAGNGVILWLPFGYLRQMLNENAAKGFPRFRFKRKHRGRIDHVHGSI